jgi:hypothetical protein
VVQQSSESVDEERVIPGVAERVRRGRGEGKKKRDAFIRRSMLKSVLPL